MGIGQQARQGMADERPVHEILRLQDRQAGAFGEG
jgi:hypothetical protein